MLSAEAFPEELQLLSLGDHRDEEQSSSRALQHQIVTAPLFTFAALAKIPDSLPQRGLLGKTGDDRIYFNANAPSSGVICGVQGSGKSHTVACILENSLLQDNRIGQLPEPLAALVFHFDEQNGSRPCEAAYLSSPSAQHASPSRLPGVTVLVSPSNLARRRRAYASLPNVRVEPLFLSEQDVTAPRMLALMGCDNLDTMPLYMQSALLVIRSMGCDAFSYREFKRRLEADRLNPAQQAMLKLRMDLLESFLRPAAPNLQSYFAPGEMTLVDLTDPFLDGLTASVLFDIVLGSFMEWRSRTGKIVVLDEAHKYLTNSDSARLNSSIASIIRQQRHLATRVIIATQEPTVIPATILDLASFIFCHRFSSPSWCTHLSRHVSAGADVDWFGDVMQLQTGDALVFSPTALTVRDGSDETSPVFLGRQAIHVRVRQRLTCDGGASLLAMSSSALGSPTESPAYITPPSTSLPSPNIHTVYQSPRSFFLPPAAPGTPQSQPTTTPRVAPFSFAAFAPHVAPSPPRYQGLLDALQNRHPAGARVPVATIAGCTEIQRLRGTGEKGWVVRLVEEAAAAGAVLTGGMDGGQWVQLVS